MEPDANRIVNLTAPERETIVNGSDGDRLVRIWTAQRRHITRLRRHPDVTEVAHGVHGKSPWAEFTIPATSWSPATGVKRRRRKLSENEKAVLGERLAQARSLQETML